MQSLRISLTLIFTALAFCLYGQGYTINGRVTGLPDSTWLYLRDAKAQIELDSVQIIGERFFVSGAITPPAKNVYLHTAKYTDYVSFWLTNDAMTVSLKSGAFKKGEIKGSSVQDESVRMSEGIADINRRSDSLGSAFEKTTDTSLKKIIRAQIKEADSIITAYYMNYVKTHPKSIIAANLLSVYCSTWGKERSAALYNGLSPEMMQTEPAQAVKDFISLNQEINVGDKYADFAQQNPDGKLIRLSDFKAKYLLLDFWASWCGPCREDNAKVLQVYNTYKTKGFEILGVSLDDSKKHWLDALKEDKITWPTVSDLRGDQNRAALIYGISFVPMNYLIDQNGVIIAKNLRGEKLAAKLKELMP